MSASASTTRAGSSRLNRALGHPGGPTVNSMAWLARHGMLVELGGLDLFDLLCYVWHFVRLKFLDIKPTWPASAEKNIFSAEMGLL